MEIDRVELSFLKLPYFHFFETSFGRETGRTFILIRITAEGMTGYGEVVASSKPLYSYETTTTAWHILKEFLIPLLFKENLTHPVDFSREAKRYHGHPMAKAGVEAALWDLKAKKDGKPLWRIYGGHRKEIPAGVSLGIQDSVRGLLDRAGQFLSEGYRRIKIKIKPGWDVDVCRLLREEFPEMKLQVDANGAYSREDRKTFQALDEFQLMMIEQPFPPYDLWDHSQLQKNIQTPLCLDESILSVDSARQAQAMGSCRIINIKSGRVGGIVESIRIHDWCHEHSIPVWCGGMLESGIGRAHNIHLATLPNFQYPNDISASKRYYKEDLVSPSIEITPQGTILVPDNPGIGIVPHEARIKKHTLKHEIFRA